MKKIIGLLSVVLLFFALSAAGSASTEQTEGLFTYTIFNDRAIIIKCDESASGTITIPSELGGYPVTSISESFDIISSSEAFSGCSDITEIVIPDSVTWIEEAAFSGCSGLVKFTVAENNPSYCAVDGNLFNKDKTGLIRYSIGKTDSTYEVPDGVTFIGNEAFIGCKSLTDIILPPSINSIETDAFCYCENLTNINLPNGITSISVGTFFGCENLKNIIIPEHVTIIDEDAFYNCESLTSITIPDSVTFIGKNAFYQCNDLTDVYYSGTQNQWKKIFGNTELGTIPIQYRNYVLVFLNQKKIEFDQIPIIENDRTLVPLRAIFEALGATVEWNEETETVTSSRGAITVSFQIGSNQLYKNGQEIMIDVPAQIMDGKTMVPLRAVAESFDCLVEWEENTQTVWITE